MVAGLLDGGEYRRSRLLAAWGHAHPWRMLASRLEEQQQLAAAARQEVDQLRLAHIRQVDQLKQDLELKIR